VEPGVGNGQFVVHVRGQDPLVAFREDLGQPGLGCGVRRIPGREAWPGVSIKLTVTPSTANEVTADLIVIPRCRSSASESVCVVPASTLPISSMTPAAWSSRSVSVVLPASTCARIPKLSVR